MNTSENPTSAPSTALTVPKAEKAPIAVQNGIVQLNSLEDAYRFARCIAESGFAPKGLDKPESIVIALQHAAELGLAPLQGLQNIALINGRPGIYGDAALALVRKSGLLVAYSETEVGEVGKDSFGVKVTATRKGEGEASEMFTVADAKTANLWGKQGPWTQYPRRMLKFRARGFLLRDQFGDVLKGLRTVEELFDSPPEPKNVTGTAVETAGLAGALGSDVTGRC